MKEVWNLKDIFVTEEDWKAAKEEMNVYLDAILACQGKLGESSAVLADCYENYERLLQLIEKVYAYAMLAYHQDMANGKSFERYKEAEGLNAEISAKLAFMEPELIQIEESKIERYLSENERLKPYARVIREVLKQKKHVLTKEVEKVLSSYAEVFGLPENAHEIFSDVDLKFPAVKTGDGKELEVTQEKYTSLLKDKDRNIRKQAFDSMYSTYASFIHTITELYLGRVKQATITSKLRNYPSSLYRAVDHDDSSIKVYENLVEVVRENLKVNHHYMKMKKKLLDLKEMHLYDIYVNPVETEKENISYEDSKKMILEALKPMGEEYLSMLEKAFESQWIDVYERPNKRSGGYSMGVYGVHPYILVNYQNTLRDTSTVAHELGHTMHSWYSNENQNIMDSNYTIMVAEVASTVNEMLLAEYLIQKETNPRKKAELLLEQLENIRATLIRQTMFSEFEKIVHEKIEVGENLSSDKLCEMYYQLNKEYFGEEVTIDKEIQYEWARIPHFYSCFYVYKYATGIAAAMAIASKILAKEEGFVEKYQEMLKQGCSKKSIDLLKMVDVDLESKKPYEDAFKVYERYIKELEELL